MTTLFPITFDEIWMRPGDAGMEFCGEADAFCSVELEVDIVAISLDDWRIESVRMKISDFAGFIVTGDSKRAKFRDRYADLTGPLLEAAKAHLMATEMPRLEEYVQQDFLPASIGAYADRRIDDAKHEVVS